jgi:general secretion pathway protein N
MKLRGRAIKLAAFSVLCAGAEPCLGQSLPIPSAKANPLSSISLDSLPAMHEHPLFSASRRPPPTPIIAEAPKPDAPAPVSEKPSVTLVGVIYSPRLRIGIFTNGSDKSLFRAHVGETVLGWAVRDIDRRAVTLEKANECVTLELKRAMQTTETAAMQQDPGIPLHGIPAGTIKPFATADRDR